MALPAEVPLIICITTWLAFPAINPATHPTAGTAKIPVAIAPQTPDIP